MAKKTVTPQQAPKSPVSTTNGEGNEKLDGTSSSLSDIQGYSTADPDPKIAGMANGYAQTTRTK